MRHARMCMPVWLPVVVNVCVPCTRSTNSDVNGTIALTRVGQMASIPHGIGIELYKYRSINGRLAGSFLTLFLYTRANSSIEFSIQRLLIIAV